MNHYEAIELASYGETLYTAPSVFLPHPSLYRQVLARPTFPVGAGLCLISLLAWISLITEDANLQ